MSMPVAGDGTPSRWSCALKSSEATFGISPTLDPAHETAGIENPTRIKGLLEGAHDRKSGWRRSPDVERRLERDGRRRHPHTDDARRGLGQHPGVRWNSGHHELAGG